MFFSYAQSGKEVAKSHKEFSSILTSDSVKTSAGDFIYFDGLPSTSTVSDAYRFLDLSRASSAFLNGIPMASIQGIKAGHDSIGAYKPSTVCIFSDLMDSASLFLTGNTDTVYASSILDLKRDGPTVVEVPPGVGPGTVNDAYFRFVVDMGVVGPDKGKGGKYLIYHTDHSKMINDNREALEKEYYLAPASPSYINWLILRGFLKDGSPEYSDNLFKTGLKIYPFDKKASPPETDFINGTGKIFNTIHSNDFSFFEEIHDVLSYESSSFLDPEIRGIFNSLGVSKGVDFNPDKKTQKVLSEGIDIGNAIARSLTFRPRDKSVYIYKDRKWFNPFPGGSYKWLVREGDGGRNLDGRAMFFYIATVNTPAMVLKMVGKGSQYGISALDTKGNYLNGGGVYRLTVPANVPVKDFWSVVVYDPQTRSQLVSDSQPYPSLNSKRNNMKENKDGTVDIYFSPTLPQGVSESNWIQTVEDKGWFAVFRLYGPLEPWFEQTWKLNDIEKIEESGKDT